jgi:ribosomal protein S12 methylthiotransferase
MAERKAASGIRIGILSLGCPKTLVDSEIILGKLDPRRYRIVPSVTDCDIAILNTCSFIREAQEESIDRIFQLVELKKEGLIRSLVVVGCLVQQFPGALKDQIGDIDAFVGSGEYQTIGKTLEKVAAGQKVSAIGGPGYLATARDRRVVLTPRHYRYVKISEGCNRRCSFCTIPAFRGRHRSRSSQDIVKETRALVQQGAREIILTGQDTTFFGMDTTGRYQLVPLLKKLEKIENLRWIRLLYAYPSGVTKDLLRTMRESAHMCRYLDIPLQHFSNPVLKAMRRGTTEKSIRKLVSDVRTMVPGAAMRTTFIVGFPGETERDFKKLLTFMKESRFERLGIFTYSCEKGTPAAELPEQVPEKIKRARLDEAMRLQQEISTDINRGFIGKSMEILIEEKRSGGENEYLGRTFMDAPEVDGNVFVRSRVQLGVGRFYQGKITGSHEYDLVARL